VCLVVKNIKIHHIKRRVRAVKKGRKLKEVQQNFVAPSGLGR
jgi:hypothetical protein